MEPAFLPKFIINKIDIEFKLKYHLNVLLSVVLIILLLLLLKNSWIYTLNCFPHCCLFKQIFTYDCPFCGTIRSVYELQNLNFHNSISYNISGIGLIVFLILQIPLRAIALFSPVQIIKVNILSRLLGNCFLISVFLNWVFKIMQAQFLF